MFKDQNEFSLHIENLKVAHGFETYIEAIVYFHEHETDHEMDTLSKMLNRKIINSIQYEAEQSGQLKTDVLRLF